MIISLLRWRLPGQEEVVTMNDSQKALIGDRYRILHSVDEGGTSYIFLVQDIKLDKQYAMKLLKTRAVCGSAICKSI